MAITFDSRFPLPVGADPSALQKLGLIKAFGVILPRSSGKDAAEKFHLVKLEHAIKHEKRVRQCCALKCNLGTAAFKKSAKTYLSSKRCLLVALFDYNARQSIGDRKSIKELITLANSYEILKKLNEPAKVWQQPKASRNGIRIICSFGPVACAAQYMVKKLLTLTYQPQDFQFTKLTFAEKVQQAMYEINEKGYAHVTEIDIKEFFPSFTEDALLNALPLPKEAIRQIVLANSASWGPHPKYVQHGCISSPPGIPQGSASSAAVADWCVANMALEMLPGSLVINHADNFFAFSASNSDAQYVSKALSSGIAGLPGGNFSEFTKQLATIDQGFQMLGCWVHKSDGKLEADPTNENVKKLYGRARRQRQRVYRRLTAATNLQSEDLRIKGLQDYLRFENMVTASALRVSSDAPK